MFSSDPNRRFQILEIIAVPRIKTWYEEIIAGEFEVKETANHSRLEGACMVSKAKNVAYIAAYTSLTAVLAQITIYLPFTPIPITLQIETIKSHKGFF